MGKNPSSIDYFFFLLQQYRLLATTCFISLPCMRTKSVIKCNLWNLNIWLGLSDNPPSLAPINEAFLKSDSLIEREFRELSPQSAPDCFSDLLFCFVSQLFSNGAESPTAQFFLPETRRSAVKAQCRFPPKFGQWHPGKTQSRVIWIQQSVFFGHRR